MEKRLSGTYISIDRRLLNEHLPIPRLQDRHAVKVTTITKMSTQVSKRGIKMVLSGEGSDELFAGYLYNLCCPSPEEMQEECRLKISQLCI